MKSKLKTLLVTAVILALAAGLLPGVTTAAGALVVTDGHPAASLVTALLGSGVSVSNISYAGTAQSSGIFTGGTGIVGFEEGVILSSGKAVDVVGPNNAPNKTTTLNTPGDGNLNALVAPRVTYDATVLEFDFIPDGDTIHWQYVFSSEEYLEYVNTQFNDVFGFFLNGTNVALVPGSGAIVSINSINPATNPAYFINNGSGALNTQMDGLTTVLTVSAPVNKNQVNHIKLAIADTSDRVYDSNVFLKKGSFSTTPPPCTGNPSLTFQSPLSPTVTANVNAGDTFPIDFRWMSCSGSAFDSSVTVRVRNNATGALIAGYTLGYDIHYNPGSGIYSQPFDTAKHAIPAGTTLKVMVYFGGRLRGTALVKVN